MTGRDEHVLRIMADPASHVTSLTERDKQAIRTVLAILKEQREEIVLLRQFASSAIDDMAAANLL